MANRFSKTPKAPMQALKNRIVELRSIPARNILGAPFNYRRHPENQQNAIAASLEEIGFYDPLKVFRTEDMPADCFMLVDGHARQELISDRIGPDTLIPCIITDLDEVEAKRALLTHDALGAMAESDKGKLDDLLRTMETESQDLADMLEALAKESGCEWAKEAEKEQKEEEGERESGYVEQYGCIVICDGEEHQQEVFEKLTAEGYNVKVVTT